MKNKFHLTKGPFFHALVAKIQDGETDIAVNSIDLVIPSKTCKCNMHFQGKFPTGKQDYLFKIPLIPGNFSVKRTENVCSINTPTGISPISR